MREVILWTTGAITIFAWFVMIKNIVTNVNLNKVCHAIHAYNTDIIWKKIDGEKIDYGDMNGYCKTLFRFWDWGYKNILPKDKYELIKKYIHKEKHYDS